MSCLGARAPPADGCDRPCKSLKRQVPGRLCSLSMIPLRRVPVGHMDLEFDLEKVAHRDAIDNRVCVMRLRAAHDHELQRVCRAHDTLVHERSSACGQGAKRGWSGQELPDDVIDHATSRSFTLGEASIEV